MQIRLRYKILIAIGVLVLVLVFVYAKYWYLYSGVENPFYAFSLSAEQKNILQELQVQGIVVGDIKRPNNEYVVYVDSQGEYKKLLYHNLGYVRDDWFKYVTNTWYTDALQSPADLTVSVSANGRFLRANTINYSAMPSSTNVVDLAAQGVSAVQERSNAPLFQLDDSGNNGLAKAYCTDGLALSPSGQYLATYAVKAGDSYLAIVDFQRSPSTLEQIISAASSPENPSIKTLSYGVLRAGDTNDVLKAPSGITHGQFCKLMWSPSNKKLFFSTPTSAQQFNYIYGQDLLHNGQTSGIAAYDVATKKVAPYIRGDQLPDARAYSFWPLPEENKIIIQTIEKTTVYTVSQGTLTNPRPLFSQNQKIIGIVY